MIWKIKITFNDFAFNSLLKGYEGEECGYCNCTYKVCKYSNAFYA